MEANEAAEAHTEAKYSRGHQRAIYEVLVLVLVLKRRHDEGRRARKEDPISLPCKEEDKGTTLRSRRC